MSTPPADPAASPLRTRFLEAGMRVLARDGYAGFKQSAVCSETGLTTGAFYHSFRKWKAFEDELIAYWRSESTEQLVAWVEALPSPAGRIDALVDVALALPHQTEAAIRIWAAGDAAVGRAVAEVDAMRTAAVTRAFQEIGVDGDHAQRLAAAAMLMLVGHECSNSSIETLEWSMRHSLETDPQVRAAIGGARSTGEGQAPAAPSSTARSSAAPSSAAVAPE